MGLVENFNLFFFNNSCVRVNLKYRKILCIGISECN